MLRQDAETDHRLHVPGSVRRTDEQLLTNHPIPELEPTLAHLAEDPNPRLAKAAKTVLQALHDK